MIKEKNKRRINRRAALSAAGLGLTLVAVTATPAAANVPNLRNSTASVATIQVYSGSKCNGTVKFVPKGGRSPLPWTRSVWVYINHTAYFQGQPPGADKAVGGARGKCKGLVPSSKVIVTIIRSS